MRPLSPQLRRAARFVVENPDDVAMRSQRQVAQVADLPAPTFTRLARAIGFDSYDGLRDLCRRGVMQNQTMLADRARAMVRADSAMPFVERHATATIRNTQALIDQIDQEALAEVSKLLAQANRVVLIGELSARGVVDYACYIANMSLTGWKVLGRDGESLSSELASLETGDACLVLSNNPYANRAVEMARSVAECDVPVIAVTDNALSPLTEVARTSFFVGTQSPQFFPSHAAVTVFFEILVAMVIKQRGERARQRIAAIERQNHKLNEYWQDGPARTQGE